MHDAWLVDPSCDHDAAPIPCLVLDPFMGSGTTALVARKHGRRSIGIELNPEYADLAARRLQQLSLFAGVAGVILPRLLLLTFLSSLCVTVVLTANASPDDGPPPSTTAEPPATGLADTPRQCRAGGDTATGIAQARAVRNRSGSRLIRRQRAATRRLIHTRPWGNHWLERAFLCIKAHEGAWGSKTGNGFYGGLQMDRRSNGRTGRSSSGRSAPRTVGRRRCSSRWVSGAGWTGVWAVAEHRPNVRAPMSELMPLSELGKAIAEIETVVEAKALYDKLETLSQYAHRFASDLETQNEIAKAKLQTARKGGALILAGPNRYESDSRRASESLPDGFTWSMSSRWQKIARIPANELDDHVADVLERGEELALAGVLRLAAKVERDEKRRRNRLLVERAPRLSEMVRRSRQSCLTPLGTGAMKATSISLAKPPQRTRQ